MDKTKEEIIYAAFPELNNHLSGTGIKNLCVAMQAYADQEKRRTVVEVLNLLTKKDSQFTINYGEEKRWEGARASFTSEGLYDLYLQSIT